MTAYSVIMFATAILFFVIGIAIRKGNTKLIHDYHQTNIEEPERIQYGREFSNGLFMISATLFVSGVTALFGDSDAFFAASLIMLFVGLIISFIFLIKAQKKYNGGLF